MATKSSWHAPFLEALRQTGNVSLAAKRAGIERKTAYRHRARSKRFAEEWDEALEEAVDLLEEEARRRAIEGVVGPGGERRYSDTLLIFLLKAHRPKKYRDNVKLTHEGKLKHENKVKHEGEILVVKKPDLSLLTYEELVQLRAIAQKLEDGRKTSPAAPPTLS